LAALYSRLQSEGSMLQLVGIVHEAEHIESFRPFFPGGTLVLDAERKVCLYVILQLGRRVQVCLDVSMCAWLAASERVSVSIKVCLRVFSI
jgi:hypothetical protein